MLCYAKDGISDDKHPIGKFASFAYEGGEARLSIESAGSDSDESDYWSS